MSRNLIALVLLTHFTAICGALAAPADRDLSGQVAKLSDPDPSVRESATRLLWSAGVDAQDLLRAVADDDNPETSGRARVILQNIQWGLMPDSPPEVFQLLDQYRKGGDPLRAAVYTRLSELGSRGIRVLLAIYRNEQRPSDHQLVLAALVSREHDSAAGLIAEGDLGSAAAVLSAAAPLNESAARDYAAFLLVRGNLPEKIAELKASAAGASDGVAARELVYFARAGGDLALAASAARQTADPALLDQVLIEQEDWKTLAERFRSRSDDGNSIETQGFAATFSRLAGDVPGIKSSVDALKVSTGRDAEGYWKCAQVLCLNDRVDEAIDLLIKHEDYLRAADILLPRMQYRRVVELVLKAQNEHYGALPELQTRGAVALRFIGQRDEGKKTLDQLEAAARGNFSLWWAIIDARREIGGAADAQNSLMTALRIENGNTALALMGQGGLPETFPAAFWWEFFRRHAPGDPPAATWKALADMAQSTDLPSIKIRKHPTSAPSTGAAPAPIKPEDLDRFGELARQETTQRAAAGVTRNNSLYEIGQTMLSAGRADVAEKCFRAMTRSAGAGDAQILMRIGDCQMARSQWSAAADNYLAAWLRDRARPLPLVYRAVALLKAGDERQAREVLALVHLLPLGADSTRAELADALAGQNLPIDARRERDLALATGQFLSMSVCKIERELGYEAAAKAEYATAVRMWNKSFLLNLKTHISFSNPWANVVLPAMVHKAKAMASIRANDAAGAMREARICGDTSPGDADTMIQLVTDFKSQGHQAESDALFQSTRATFAKVVEQYPNSGPAHNLLAWFEGKCGRELDDALVHAKRATDLEPNNTASLDTLAEVYFQRGDAANAIKAMNKCVELEPEDEQHRKQLERFGAK